MESTAIKLTEASASSSSPSSLLLTSGASGRVNALLSLRALRALFLLLKAMLLLLLAPFRGRATNISSSVASPSSASVILAEKSSKEIENKLQDSVRSHRTSPVLRVPAAMVPRRSNHNNSKNNNNNNLLVSGDSDVAARRALAIRRATQDDDRMSVREVSLFVNSKGETLFTQSWTPVSASSINVRGLVVILHGLNEHSGRYSDFAKKLNANGYKVYGMDWIGHGGSDGLHAYVHSLYDVANDLKAFLKNILKENSGLPCFCFGHSTGAAIILKAMLDPELEGLIEGVVLTSPAVRVQPSHPIFGMLAPIVSLLFPRYQLSAANKNGIIVSRDPDALVAKYSDPLVYTGSIRVRTGSEILRISSYLQQHLSNLKVPFLVLHGSDDAVTDPEASMKLYEEASSIDKSIKLYPNLLHDLLFELERETVANDIIKWLNSRI